jgi:hypothetical protein
MTIPHARLAVRTILFAGVLALLAPIQTRAGGVPNPVELTVSFAGRPGFPGDVFVVANLRSVFSAPVIGDLAIYSNGQQRKIEMVITGSQALVSVNLGRIDSPVMACATFGGIADTGDENWQSVQATGCNTYGPPPPRLEPPRTPSLVGQPGLTSRLRLP